MTKVLLVEDDKSLREIYGVRLLAEGYDIVSAGDGEEALAMAIKEKPTLIISDVMMPKISGFDMLDILRSTTETRDIKVIMMTALSSEDQRARGEQLGADRYLVKSQVGIEDVVRTVHEVLGDTPGAGAKAVAAAATPAEASETPAAEPAEEEKPDTSDDKPAEDASSDVANTSVTPGNGEAGPLPPQPTEIAAPTPVVEPVVVPGTTPESSSTESTLPQPTAPFSSERPANLGEEIVHPEDTPATPVEPATETPAPAVDVTAEPAATVEPVVPPVPASESEPLAITPVEPVVSPPVDPPADPAADGASSTPPPAL
jgi:DNA-binding response OmpR family regulator